MHGSWQEKLELAQDALAEIDRQLNLEADVTPPGPLIMRAFEQPIDAIKVLLIGQDPYPSRGVACGLAFAVPTGVRQPQSLKNLMRELAADIPEATNFGELSKWSANGVMLLNSALTTRIATPGAHAKLWNDFTKLVIEVLDREQAGNLVCLSLGEHAKKLSAGIIQGQVVQATHPSPLSANRGFFGSRIYSRVNSALKIRSLSPLDWSC